VAYVTYHHKKEFGKLRLCRAVRWKDLDANLSKASGAAEAAASDVLSSEGGGEFDRPREKYPPQLINTPPE